MPAALLLPGQGAQYAGMGTGLYRGLPEFAAVLDEIFTLMGAAGDELRSDWLAADPVLPMDHVCRSQPLLFAIDYALGRLLMNMGLRPAVLLGHSIGELAAATLADVFDLKDAIAVLLNRVGQLADAPPGGMVAVAAARAEIGPHLRRGVEIGAINAPRQTVISGAETELRASCDSLRDAGFTLAPVFSRTPFHSAVLEPVVAGARQLLATVPLRSPRIELISGYTARPLTGAEAADPVYWARQPVDPVLFWPALVALLARGPALLIECGPGRGLTTLARRHRDVRSGRCTVTALIGSAEPDPREEPALFKAAVDQLSLPPP